jgi:hypothetical protein
VAIMGYSYSRGTRSKVNTKYESKLKTSLLLVQWMFSSDRGSFASGIRKNSTNH